MADALPYFVSETLTRESPALLQWGDVDFKRARIVACKPLSNYRVWIRSDDGLEGEIDLRDLVGRGVFEAWKSVDFFNQVRVDQKSDTLAWGEEIDLDPYVLREKLLEPKS